MLAVDTNRLPVTTMDKRCNIGINTSAEEEIRTNSRSDGSYEQGDYIGGGSESVMSSQELTHSYNTHGASGLFPSSPAHYFLHAQYHPQFNQSKPLLQPDYHGNQLAPSSQSSVRLPEHFNGKATPNRQDYKDYNQAQLPSPHLNNKAENNHYYGNHLDNQVNSEPQKANNYQSLNEQISRSNKDSQSNLTPKLEDNVPTQEQYLNSEPKPLPKETQENQPDKLAEIQSEAPATSEANHKPVSPLPSKNPSTGLTPDDTEAKRRIASFIADQDHQADRAENYSSPEQDNRSRHDSFYNKRYGPSSPREGQDKQDRPERPTSKDGSETGSSYRYGDLNIRSSISSDEGSNSHFQNHRDSYSGRSSSLSPVSSNGHQGSRSDSAPPTTPNRYLSPGASYPGFPHSSTPNHSPHKLPPGVHPDNKDLFFCHLCSYVGTSKYHFNAHMDSHFEHRCPHCDYTSRTEGRLKRHMKDFHCENPPDNFSGMKMIRQTGRPKMFKCKQCDYQTEVKVDFWEHSRSHIKEDKVLQCPKCPFVTEYKHHLEYHLRNHFGSKPFKCNKCNYACVNKSMLNSHMKSHTNVYQYRCADCTYATKYCHSLKLHLKKYNHKPATVLNPDGSLPTDGSGDFELVSKRGPPRGPRSVKRDKSPLVEQGVVLPHRTMPGPPPPPMNSLMSPLWPMMAAAHAQLGNGMRPPPPLIPVSGIGPLCMGLPGDPKMTPSLLPPGFLPGTKTKCIMCDFSADSPIQLTQHMFQVHASGENQDLFNMYGIQADAIMEEAMRTAADTASRVAASTLNKNNGPPSTSSSSFSSPSAAQIPTPSWMKQEGKEDNVTVITPAAPRNGDNGALDLTKPKSDFPFGPMSGMDFARVLKRPLSEDDSSPTQDKPETSDSNADSSPTPRKRSRKGKAYKLDTICMKLQERYGPESPAAADDDDYMSDYNSEQGESNHATDRPSSAPGLEHQTSESRVSEDEVLARRIPKDELETRPRAYTMPERPLSDPIPVHLAEHLRDRSLSEGHERISPVIDYSQIHNSLRELNNGTDSQDGSAYFGENPEDIVIQSDNPEGDVAQAMAEAQSRRRESVGSAYSNSNSINRRKMFLMRHNDQQAAEAAARAAIGVHISPIARPRPSPEQVSPAPMPHVIAPEAQPDLDMVEEPSKGSVYECARCAIMFRDCIMYTMHMGYHGFQDPYKCNMCGHQAKDRIDFFLHIARAAHE